MTNNSMITPELLDQLLANYTKPEEAVDRPVLSGSGAAKASSALPPHMVFAFAGLVQRLRRACEHAGMSAIGRPRAGLDHARPGESRGPQPITRPPCVHPRSTATCG